jgi:predicted DNA-binding protein YlxM (UPF0122 family)
VSAQRKGFDLHPARSAAPDVSLPEIARRAGLSRDQLVTIFRREVLEPTYSIEEVCARFGCEKTQIHDLISLGKRHGAGLDPRRGGLWPTFKPSHKSRRIPLSAIERHEAHMARVHDHMELRAS